MKEKEIRDDIASIRSLMERSSKFISLSGLSGVLAGIYALIGAAAYYVINGNSAELSGNTNFTSLALIAIAVLIAAVLTAVIFSINKAKKNGQTIWGKTSRELSYHMAVPLVAGGLLILIFISRGYFDIIAAATLIFYGLALVAAGNFTFNDIKFLGICQIILGLAAACYPVYGLLCWAIGFGILHIVYGSVMYLKYDR